LSFIPFAALKPKGGKHLIENHPIGIASSLRTLGWATKQYKTLKAKCTISGKNPMLLVGDPFPLPIQEKLDPLDDAIKEVNRIATMLPENSMVILLQEHATLENVISALKTTAWCHIASHGKVSPEYPQGVLFMSCTNEVSPEIDTGTSFSEGLEQQRSSGLLTAETICNNVRCMTAHAAVISACKIGLGKKTGEGLLGMSRAFMQAGVPLVLAPLRAVDSRLGSAFMQHLYEKLVAGENVMFALRNTMVDVLQKRVKVDLTAAEKENNEVVKWQLWDWAAWMAVGFPGVCLPLSVTTPNLDGLRITEAESKASCSY
jgi:CHAT domain-containing protein